MEKWQEVWRKGIAPLINNEGLIALRSALIDDDPALLQGATTSPPPLQAVQDWPVEGACAITYCGWKGSNLQTVGEVEEYFAKICFESDRLLGKPAECRHFLGFFDDYPRGEVREKLLIEVALELKRRSDLENKPAVLTRVFTGRNEESNLVNGTKDYDCKQKDMAKLYAVCLMAFHLDLKIDFKSVNDAIQARWPKGLNRIKTQAHKIYERKVKETKHASMETSLA